MTALDDAPFDAKLDRLFEMHAYFGARNIQLGKPKKSKETLYVRDCSWQ
jgi:hypothetical protein